VLKLAFATVRYIDFSVLGSANNALYGVFIALPERVGQLAKPDRCLACFVIVMILKEDSFIKHRWSTQYRKLGRNKTWTNNNQLVYLNSRLLS